MSESSVARLYSAAVGPVGSAYYQAVFSRFEVAGRARLSWNWAAGLLTLNWLLFRKLWLAALAYWLALLGLPVLILGLGRLVFQVPMSIEAGLWLSCAVLSLAVPGAWGNAWLYAGCKQRIAKALAATPTLEDACRQLTESASTKKQAIGLGLANIALLCVLALAYTSFFTGSAQEDDEDVAAAVTNLPAPVKPRLASPVQAPLSPASQAVSAAEAAASAASAVAVVAIPASGPASAASAAAVPASATASVSAVASAPNQARSLAKTTASAPASTQALFTAKATASASVPASAPTQAQPRAKASVSEPALVSTTPAPVPSAASTPAATHAAVPRTTPVSKPNPAAAKASRAASGKSAPAKPSKASSSPATKEVFVNVGLFADPDNARHAYVKLVKAGIPAGREVIWPPVGSSKSKLTRVRAGPFANRAQAKAAVAQIKALQLDAVVAP